MTRPRARPGIAVLGHNAQRPVSPPEHPEYGSEADVVEVARAIVANRSTGPGLGEPGCSRPRCTPLLRVRRRTPRARRPATSLPSISSRALGGPAAASRPSHGNPRTPGASPTPAVRPKPNRSATRRGWPRRYSGATACRPLRRCWSPVTTPRSRPRLPRPLFRQALLTRRTPVWGSTREASSRRHDAGLRDRVAMLSRANYGPNVMIESYLPGPEFNVGVLGVAQ